MRPRPITKTCQRQDQLLKTKVRALKAKNDYCQNSYGLKCMCVPDCFTGEEDASNSGILMWDPKVVEDLTDEECECQSLAIAVTSHVVLRLYSLYSRSIHKLDRYSDLYYKWRRLI